MKLHIWKQYMKLNKNFFRRDERNMVVKYFHEILI